MKFKTKVDEVQYTILGLNEFEVRKRLKVLKDKDVGKDKEKSRDMKNRWRRDKHKLKKGIRKWHKSTKGKRFHRALGRFNALRESETVSENSAYIYYNWYSTLDKNKKEDELRTISISQVTDALFGLSSINSHIMLELQYYEPDPEAMSEFLEIAQNFISDSAFLNEKLLQAYETGIIHKNDFDLLIEIFQFFLDPKAYLYVKRDLNGLKNDEKSQEFTKQLEYVENVDITSEEIFESIDSFFKIKDNK